jgi:hypothetical protein
MAFLESLGLTSIPKIISAIWANGSRFLCFGVQFFGRRSGVNFGRRLTP